MVGFDEVGKGDLFGPLVLCGVQDNPNLCKLPNIKDSKKLSNKNILLLAPEIKKIVKYEILEIIPFEYNKLYSIYKNQSLILKQGYENLISRFPDESHFIIDKFSNGNKHNIRKDSVLVELKPKADNTYVAVSAASIIAREVLLRWFEFHPKLSLGATNDAKRCLKYVKEKDRVKLVKMHFRV